MLFSYKMLKRLANLPQTITLEKVVNALNQIGFEVEKTTYWGDVFGIKYGEILKIYPNPNSNKLTVCEIAFDDKIRLIQTTANNVKPGMTIIAFVPGSKMGKITFQTRKMAQIISEGMLTSLNELGAEPKLLRNGIIDNIQEYKKIDLKKDPIIELDLQDYILDVNILANRPDANSYLIMAKELAAYFQTNVLKFKLNMPSLNSNIKVKNGKSKILSFLECHNNFEITLQEQLLLIKNGIKTISNIVDLTNLTLIMTGQAIHAYDKNKVGKNFIAKLYTGNVELLGHKKIQLKNNLIIENDNIPISLAGVMGFETTNINSKAQTILLELGKFNIKDIRNSLKIIKLESLAGMQSSKKLGNGTIELAYKYLFYKLKTFSNPINFVISKNIKIQYDKKLINQIAGLNITLEKKYLKVIQALEKLEFKFLLDKVIVPRYRNDLESCQDLCEEIFRFYGLENFKPIITKITPYKINNLQNWKSKIIAQGYQEVMTYTLISKKQNIFNPFNFKKTMKLQTFVSKQREVIRNSYVASFLEIIEYNDKCKIKDISIFDQGMINNGTNVIALASTCKTFEEIKVNIINLLAQNIQFIRTKNQTLHPGITANIVDKKEIIGWIGKIHPKWTNKNVIMAEFIIPNYKIINKIKQYSKEPLKTRDITISLQKKEDIREIIEKLIKLKAFSIKVIDQFINQKKKITIRITANDKIIKKIDKQYN